MPAAAPDDDALAPDDVALSPDDGKALAWLYQHGRVLDREDGDAHPASKT